MSNVATVSPGAAQAWAKMVKFGLAKHGGCGRPRLTDMGVLFMQLADPDGGAKDCRVTERGKRALRAHLARYGAELSDGGGDVWVRVRSSYREGDA
jgi:hypothetical protein